MKIIKRDGRLAEFDIGKIRDAVNKALISANIDDDYCAENIAQTIRYRIPDNNNVEVDVIHGMVEDLLRELHPDAYIEYTSYRHKRTVEREKNSNIIKVVFDKTAAVKVENNNANVDEYTFDGRKKEASDAVQRSIAISLNMPDNISSAHTDGYLYEHDLSEYNVGSTNCLFLDFAKIIKSGFKTRNGSVRGARSVATAFQLVVVAIQCQSQIQFGGAASAHIDFDLAPYVKISFYKHFVKGAKYLYHKQISDIGLTQADIYIDNESLKSFYPEAYEYAYDMLNEEGLQAAQGMYHNLNTLESRAGGQVPFSSLNFGRDTSSEGRLVSTWLLNASIDGIGPFHTTSIFPILIFINKKGVNAYPGDPNYDIKQLAIKSLSKRIYPNIGNGDWSEAHEDANDIDTYMAFMGCRTMIGYDINGTGYKRVARGNNVPITMILPKIAIQCGICTGERTVADLETFNSKFECLLALTRDALLERYRIISSQHPKAAPFMYNNGTSTDTDKCTSTVEPSVKHNTLAFGYIGIAEMCYALFGANHTRNTTAYDFALSIVRRINEYAAECTEKYHLNFSAYATPAENLCYTSMNKLKSQYGCIEGVTDRDYLSNSHHIPVWEKVSILEKIQLEAPFTKYATGGCITYVEVESSFVKNPTSVEQIVNYMMENNIPYGAINFPLDNCESCGYQDEIKCNCPECGSVDITRLRRVTGYLTKDYVSGFNPGKVSETNDRVKHSSIS